MPRARRPVAMRLGVVPAVALQRVGSAARATAAPTHGRQRVDHRVELGDVVDVGGGHLRDERDAPRIGDEVVFGALLAAIGWVRSSFFPPRTARTEPLSMTVQRWSSRPRRRSSASSVSWSRCQTPARCQRTKPAPTRAARPAAHLARQHLPGNAGSQDEENAGQNRAVGNRRAAVSVAAPQASLRDQRCEPRPDRVIDEGLRHARPYQAARLGTRGPSRVLKRALKVRIVGAYNRRMSEERYGTS